MSGPGLALLCISALGFAAQNAPPAAAPPARTNTVYVSVVEDSGAPVTDLTAADFAVTEDGQPRDVVLVSAASDPIQNAAARPCAASAVTATAAG